MAKAPAGRRVELADLVRTHGAAYRQAHRLTRGQHRALRAIAACRTAALGGHTEVCEHCGAIRIAYNSCRNRHCPKPVLSVPKGARPWPRNAGSRRGGRSCCRSSTSMWSLPCRTP